MGEYYSEPAGDERPRTLVQLEIAFGFPTVKAGFLKRVNDIMDKHKIPKDSFVNFNQLRPDQYRVHEFVVPCGDWTLEEEGEFFFILVCKFS